MEVDTDQVAAGTSKKATISSLISAAARTVVSLGRTVNVQVAPEPKKKKSLVKPIEFSVLRMRKPSRSIVPLRNILLLYCFRMLGVPW